MSGFLKSRVGISVFYLVLQVFQPQTILKAISIHFSTVQFLFQFGFSLIFRIQLWFGLQIGLGCNFGSGSNFGLGCNVIEMQIYDNTKNNFNHTKQWVQIFNPSTLQTECLKYEICKSVLFIHHLLVSQLSWDNSNPDISTIIKFFNTILYIH